MTILQGPVIHVQGPLPEDAERVDSRIAEMDAIVNHQSRLLAGSNRVKVARELQVDRVGWFQPARPAACGTALFAEHGAHRRLTQGQHSIRPMRRSP